MHFISSLLFTITLALIFEVGFSSPAPEPTETKTIITGGGADQELTKRDCILNNCLCFPGTRQGTYCGWCNVFSSYGSSIYPPIVTGNDALYQCTQGGSCCNNGWNEGCANRQGTCGSQ